MAKKKVCGRCGSEDLFEQNFCASCFAPVLEHMNWEIKLNYGYSIEEFVALRERLLFHGVKKGPVVDFGKTKFDENGKER